MRWLTMVLGLVGCASEQRVVQDMERVLKHSHAALVAHLLAVETLGPTLDEPTPPKGSKTSLRHGETCGCPCIERVGEAFPWVVTLDYPGTGCVPRSGLVPGVVAGHAVAEYDGATAEVGFDELTLARDHAVVGTVSGAPELSGRAVAALTLGDWSVSFDTAIVPGDDALTFDGTAQVTDPEGESTELELVGVHLPRDEISPCPGPWGGEVVQRDAPRAHIAFDDPGEGQVRVMRGRRESAAVEFCAYRTGLL